MKKFILIPGLYFTLVLSVFGQQDSIRVLFIGNSYTYFWNLPQQVTSMSRAMGIPILSRQSTSGGVTLDMHWRGERALKSQEMIQSQKFDHIVLQDHSLRPMLFKDSTYKYGHLFSDLIKKNEAKVYLYLTWGRKDNPLMQEKNNLVFRKLSKETNATLVPVGPAWEMARSLRPDVELYDPDGSHPSAIGAYLSACVFYKVLTGNSPLGLPSRLTYRDEDNELIFLNIVPMADAHFLQQIAEKTVLSFK